MRHLQFKQLSAFFVVGLFSILPIHAQVKAPAVTSAGRMTVSVQTLGENKRTPEVTAEDVVLKQGKDRLPVTGWTAARGADAGLDLFVLLDDASDTSLGSQLDDLRAFIVAQPASTAVGVGYMQNGTVKITQDFTADHNRAADALRLPLASTSAFASPYLSVMDLMNRWPKDANRHEVVMVTDGIDRFRGGQRYRGLGPTSPDVDLASSVAQRTGTVIHGVFARGVGRIGNNYWAISNGQLGMSKLTDASGGQFYYLGTQNPVSFKPYLDSLQKTLDNQFLLDFKGISGKKAGLQPVKLTTEVAGVELDAADSTWVDVD
jgi:hypothetical protein